MIQESVSIDATIRLLNEMVRLDAEATRYLVEQRVPCNQAMTAHPTIQVQVDLGQPAQVGMLGVINGLFGVDEKLWGAIAAKFEDDGSLIGFERASKFQKDI